MIADLPRSTRPTWQLVAREAAAMLAAGVLAPFGLRRTRRPTPREASQRTVVLIHGYLANPSTLFPLAAWLRLQGVGRVLTYAYSSTEGVDRAAIGLRDFLRRHVRGGRIDLVCHSMGGVVARVYLQNLGGARRVDRCITLGTPHEGTYGAYYLWSRVAGELRPDSALLGRLRATEAAAADVRFVSIIGATDAVVIPRVFARHRDEVVFDDIGHVSMLFSPAVLRRVSDELRADKAA